MIELATEQDIPTLLRMAKEFINAKYKGSITFDEHTTTKSILYLSREQCFFVKRGEDGEPIGFICGTHAPDLFSATVKAVEIAWWVDAAHRGRGVGRALLEQFERWGEAHGCRFVCVGEPPVEPEAAAALYQRRGYSRIETYWEKAL